MFRCRPQRPLSEISHGALFALFWMLERLPDVTVTYTADSIDPLRQLLQINRIDMSSQTSIIIHLSLSHYRLSWIFSFFGTTYDPNGHTECSNTEIGRTHLPYEANAILGAYHIVHARRPINGTYVPHDFQ